MALNLNGDDITDALGGGGGGPSPSDPAQDAKILTLENKTQNINSVSTDGTKTQFDNKVVVPEVDSSDYKLSSNPGTIFKKLNDTLYAGTNSGNNITTHANGVLIGLAAGQQIQSGNDNICIGANSGRDIVDSSQNILIGAASGLYKTGNFASNNISIGINSQKGQVGITTGFNNISLGSSSLQNMTSCTNNICIGSDAGGAIASGSNNTLIGVGSTTLSNPSNCTTLGQNSNVGAFTNSTALGFQATCDTNNQVSLGNNGTVEIINTGHTTCDLGSTTHKFKDLHLSGDLRNTNTISSGYVQAPIISATNTITTDKISNQDAIPTLCMELAPTTGIITVHKDILPNTGNTLNIGTNTAGGRMNEINAQILLANQEVRSNKHYNENGTAGIDISNTSTGGVNLTGSKYQGKNNQIVTLNGSGQIQQPSQNALIDANGNATFKNLELLNIASSGEIKAKKLQSNDAANTLSLLNRSTIAGKGIIIDATTNGNIQLTGDSYVGTSNAMIRLNTDGTIEKTNLLLDGAGLNNISNANTISSVNLASSNMLNSGQMYSPNFILGLFLGGTGSAGIMNINSGNVTNTGDITPITDNTEDIGTLALAYKDIHIKGDVYKNGAIYGGGGGGGVNGITSLDNGGGDIEISFTGTDYLQNGYLTVDTNGRIQVTPSLVVTNAEYDAIALKWTQERTNTNQQLVKIYLPQGVPVGQFNHTIHNVYILTQDPTNNTKQIWDVRFIGYQGSTAINEISLSNVINATEIYNNTSQAHPNQVANVNDKQHIINHFLSDYNHVHYGSFQVTNVVRIAVLSGDVGNWDESKPFFVSFDISPFVSPQQSGNITLYGSQNGFTVSNAAANYGAIPSGYTEIF
jgi:hypothetical protein